ncbi:nucleoside 2-deoxyribosyltransferase domain-containing protein [Yinghuangia seranimata]|uniref:nucleoside 2-deoxyribosyltransferase domain-containing protein n=1 Tax=Yinghuangia seranimata TaxID=408067 RepID=UPI00248B7B52|nr:nucleoside 2-deoxyribosyltransferase domain-containing protein [Yinghuangia seranimata]MDI2132580.1 nucleoside 2-deoxyribosyltransferase domain-containing protein [Yinghuangia seranimata]
MPASVTVVYANEEPPSAWHASVFLAGPTPRSADVASWRPGVLELIRRHWAGPGPLVVFVPEPRDGTAWADYDDQRRWELRWLAVADQVLFWVPRDLVTLPGLTTNDEWGWLKDSGRAVFGSPPDAAKVRYQREYAADAAVPLADGQEDAVHVVLDRVGAGAPRTAGERDVPLNVWTTPAFRQWYSAQTKAGNTLVGARVVWTLRPGPEHPVVYWAVRVAVAIAAEDGRVKDNEVVIGRPDISTVVLHRRPPGTPLRATELVLVREFRAPGASADGYVHELPGGSSAADDASDPAGVAVDELREETGLAVDPARLRPYRARQVAATVSAHRAHVFAAEATAEELERLRAARGPYGAGGSERTYVEVVTYGELLDDENADWATIGMVAQVLADAYVDAAVER